jgi:hypothetical protein
MERQKRGQAALPLALTLAPSLEVSAAQVREACPHFSCAIQQMSAQAKPGKLNSTKGRTALSMPGLGPLCAVRG